MTSGGGPCGGEKEPYRARNGGGNCTEYALERSLGSGFWSVRDPVFSTVGGFDGEQDPSAAAVVQQRMPRSSRRPAPYLAALTSPPGAAEPPQLGPELRVATYNVHRWVGVRGGKAYEPGRALTVLGEIEADVIALQEVLRPFGNGDPLHEASRMLGFHLAFVVMRIHKRGELGNAILSRW